jgi:hypothetical protein
VVYAGSYKIKTVIRLTAESELCVGEEASTFSICLKDMMKVLGFKNEAIPLMKNNLSALILAHEGGTFKRTKHLMSKEGYLRERIDQGDIILKYCPTANMHADFLTKHLSKPKLEGHLLAINIR